MRVPAILFLLLAFVYQLICLPLYTFDRVGPDFVLAAVIGLALYARSPTALVAAVLCGTANDALSLNPWGAHTLPYVVVVWFVLRMRAKIDGADRYAVLLVVMFAASLHEVVTSGVLFIDGGRAALAGWQPTLLTAAYKGAVAFVVISIAAPFQHVLAGRRLGERFTERKDFVDWLAQQ